jgi:hypothetical protein
MGKSSKQERDFAQMYTFLKRIVTYDTPAQMRRNSEKNWGLQFDECIEMAYENIQQEARNGLKGIRLPNPSRVANPDEKPSA